ncbi:Mevalonate kinase [Tripterygium wilfordii]|uniref:Mevalonate kinase n=1 Tax=Tripterygium wilfordii TaxID=458696 RepID=A0A7J7DKZ0_TRIWF|nr:mevalonate kinase-like [Tripterygium wilfordii]KAF5746746.1 Mevalonate kinase [Tripterygium wilfordii]
MEVKARAPGKIILAGEHAVVHGSTAVAASIDLYTYFTFSSASPSDSNDTLKLQFKDDALEFSWHIERIKEALPDLGFPFSSTPTTCSAESIKAVATLVEEKNIPEAKKFLASGVSAFLWLYACIQGFKPATVAVTSELPLGSGLGSSASFCVALAAALLGFSGSVPLDTSHQGWLSYEESDLELLNKWAFEGEKLIHGKPSGIDNTVSAYGNMIKFRSGSLTRIKSSFPLRMLITNTKVGRNTKALVAGVSERMLRHHDAMNFIFKAVNSISEELATILQSPVHDDHVSVTQTEEKLEELMEMNQGLLQSMGVSHASIETVLQTTLKYKLSSKLTGAGGGGCVLTLLPSLLSTTVLDKVIAELESCGFQCFTAAIGGKGAEVCFNDKP